MSAHRHAHRHNQRTRCAGSRARRLASVGALAALVTIVGPAVNGSALATAAAVGTRSPAAPSAVPRTTSPIGSAAPYLTLGWGSPPSPVAVMSATGIGQFTLAFMLAGRGCTPLWDGSRPLLGGRDAASISAIRTAGGDVSVSFGGWSGRKLGIACRTPGALTSAYEQVVDAYALRAVDVDIEHSEFTSPRVRFRVVTALAALRAARPGLRITVTFATTPTGPDADGRSLIADAASIGFQPDAWTIMPFDFGVPVVDMGTTSVAAAEGLHADLMAIYGEDAATAYAHLGISSMNGQTDEADETVSIADFEAMLTYARSNHLARLTFWMVDRDRACPTGVLPGNTCSGLAQQDWAFTSLDALFTG